MAGPITNIKLVLKEQLTTFAVMLTEAYNKVFLYKRPVASKADLQAVTTPVEGEVRAVTTANKYIAYQYSASHTSPDLTCDDGSAGGWLLTTPASASDLWQPSFDYVAGDEFSLIVDTNMLDASGDAVEAGKFYDGIYVDANGVPVAMTSGTTLDAAEVAKMNVTSSEGLGDQTLVQSEVDTAAGL